MLHQIRIAKEINALYLKILLAGLMVTPCFSFIKNHYSTETRIINIAGLVVNAQTLTPIGDAKIYDSENKLLGTTDKNGYYKVKIIYQKEGEMYFKFRVAKNGFADITHREHWGDIPNVANGIIYFGLQNNHNSTDESFSSLSPSGNLDYDNVVLGFDKVKKDREFNTKLNQAKQGNEKILLLIDGKFYIVDNGGWIQITSYKDLISINGKQTVSADKLNSVLKRKDIKGMTPIESQNAKFAIYTK